MRFEPSFVKHRYINLLGVSTELNLYTKSFLSYRYRVLCIGLKTPEHARTVKTTVSYLQKEIVKCIHIKRSIIDNYST